MEEQDNFSFNLSRGQENMQVNTQASERFTFAQREADRVSLSQILTNRKRGLRLNESQKRSFNYLSVKPVPIDQKTNEEEENIARVQDTSSYLIDVDLDENSSALKEEEKTLRKSSSFSIPTSDVRYTSSQETSREKSSFKTKFRNYFKPTKKEALRKKHAEERSRELEERSR